MRDEKENLNNYEFFNNNWGIRAYDYKKMFSLIMFVKWFFIQIVIVQWFVCNGFSYELLVCGGFSYGLLVCDGFFMQIVSMRLFFYTDYFF